MSRFGAVVWIALLGAAFSLLPGITEIVSFGSLTFLLVFGLINFLHARHTAHPGWDRRLAYLAGSAARSPPGPSCTTWRAGTQPASP